jgi:hypothetical protein
VKGIREKGVRKREEREKESKVINEKEGKRERENNSTGYC